MTISRSIFFTTAAAVTLAFSGAVTQAQAGGVSAAQSSDHTAAQPAMQSAGAAKLPAYLKQGDPPSANDPIPAPTSPVPPADETAIAQAPPPPEETISPPGSTTPRTWTSDQILTATVHQAWILSGKDEANFFEIVKELAAISAANRNLTVPDTTDAGKKAGAYIRAQAKEDHDQLLYDIVDKAVRMTGTKAPANATNSVGTLPAAHPPS